MATQRPATIQYRASLHRQVCVLIEAEYGQDLQLEGLAKRIASSRRQLQRAFTEAGSTTFRDHLTGVRMARAAELLSSESLTVREVARQVGYKQPAQFAKAFRRLHGVAPSEFRASATENQVGQRLVANAA